MSDKNNSVWKRFFTEMFEKREAEKVIKERLKIIAKLNEDLRK